MTYALGIDLGGTKVLAGVVETETGRVLGTAKKRSQSEQGPGNDPLHRLIEVANEAISTSGLKRHDIVRIGIGVAGQIDREQGLILNAPNLPGLSHTNLVKPVEKELALQVSVFNDVEAAAAGEAAHGAGKDEQDFVVVFIGTGIGGSIYRKGRPYLGATRTAGELGHMVVDWNGRLCSCGGFGHLEAYASRTAIVQAILAEIHSGRESTLKDHLQQVNPFDPAASGIRSKAIAQALEERDPLTREVLLQASEYLAAGLASVINFYNPPLLILGGGLVDAVDLFFNAVASRTPHLALAVSRSHVQIVRAALGDNSGIIGAATLAAHASV
jgi:glucokinase